MTSAKEFKVIDFYKENFFSFSDSERLFEEVKKALLHGQSVVISLKGIKHIVPPLKGLIGGLYAWGHAYKNVPDFKKKLKIKDIEEPNPPCIGRCLGKAIWWASTPERLQTHSDILQRAIDGDWDDEDFDGED